jgi:eukaryotic-like serine/threonine-protein kinase
MIGRRFGNYEVLEKIGQGGMGVVYRGRDVSLGREVALKFLPAEFSADAERLARFRNEAKLLAALNHVNIAAIYGLEEIDGVIFLAMEYVDGDELGESLRNAALPLEDALDFARQLAEGLESAHERGIIHRDLKPANLKTTAEGQLKILDFGLARAFAEDSTDSVDPLEAATMTAALTQNGAILGTAAYMSPEQARGSRIDQRTDIWSFGAILYEMITGERLFVGETNSDTMAAVLRADLDFALLPAETPEAVRRLIRRCLERDARRRLRDIGEARVRLEQWREDPGRMHEATSLMSGEALAYSSRRSLVPWLVTAVAVCAAGFMGWTLLRQQPAPAPLNDWAIEVMGEQDINPRLRRSVLISPDGAWYSWLTTDGIHLRSAAAREVKLLPGTSGPLAATFSPDSRWIAFMSGGGLYRINIEGGEPFRICDAPNSRGVAWVDENTMVFSDAISTGLKRIDMVTGEVFSVTAPDSSLNERSHRWPTVVPGQRGVLYECQFIGRDYDASDVRYLDLETGQSHTVHRGGAAPLALASGTLLFVRGHTIYAQRLDLDRMEMRGQPLAVREDVAASSGNQEDEDGSAEFTVDAQGTLFYLDMMGGVQEKTRLSWFHFDSGEIDPITEFADYGEYRISPDGSKLIAIIDRDGDMNLYVLDLVVGTELLLTSRPSMEYIGAWSPDSKRFYWTQSSDDGSRYEFWSRLVDGSQPAAHVATPDNRGNGGVWINSISADGRWLSGANFAGGNMMDLITMDLQEPEPAMMPFVVGPDPQDGSRFMADGRYIIYGTGIGDRGQMLIRRFPDTGAVWSLPGTERGWYTAEWNPGIGGVLAMDDRGIFEIPVDLGNETVTAGAPRLLVNPELSSNGRLIVGIQFHPDGKRAIVQMQERGNENATPSLAVVTGWEQDMLRRLDAGGF